jgi:hypothetical protein
MKVYTYSTARARLSSVLEESKTEEIIIKRRKGELYTVTPKTAVLRSPFDISSSGLKTTVTADDIVDMVRESRERPYKTHRPSRKAKGAS